MMRGGRTITLGDEFVRELKLMEQYAGRQVPLRGRQLVSDVLDFLFETLAPLPFAYPAYVYPPPRFNCSAVFRKQYIIIYEVSEVEVSFVFLPPSSRQGPDLELLTP